MKTKNLLGELFLGEVWMESFFQAQLLSLTLLELLSLNLSKMSKLCVRSERFLSDNSCSLLYSSIFPY